MYWSISAGSISRSSQSNAHLGPEHGQVKEAGDPSDVAFAPGAQGEIRAGLVPDQIVAEDLGGELGSNVPIEDAGPAGL